MQCVILVRFKNNDGVIAAVGPFDAQNFGVNWIANAVRKGYEELFNFTITKLDDPYNDEIHRLLGNMLQASKT